MAQPVRRHKAGDRARNGRRHRHGRLLPRSTPRKLTHQPSAELGNPGITGADAFLGLLGATAAAIGDLHSAVQTMTRDPRETSRSALLAKKAANKIRRLYDVELGRRFRGEFTMEVLKSRELLRRLDVVGLRVNEASDVLSDAAIKRGGAGHCRRRVAPLRRRDRSFAYRAKRCRAGCGRLYRGRLLHSLLRRR